MQSPNAHGRQRAPTGANDQPGSYARSWTVGARSSGNGRTFPGQEGDWIVSIHNEQANGQQAPGWAVDQATDEQYDAADPPAIAERAWELVRDAEERYSERHDEYDDPDQGGEA